MFTNSFAYPNLFDATTGKMILKEDYDSIINRVGVLLKTYKKEQYMFPQFGCTFPDVLMKYKGIDRFNKAKEAVTTAILEFEPFVNANQIEIVDTTPEDKPNSLILSITLILDKDFKKIAGTIEWSFEEEGAHL